MNQTVISTRIKPRTWLANIGCALCLMLLPVASHAADSLTVTSWGGSYAAACVQAYHKSFVATTGIRINLEDYNGGLAQIRAQVETDNVFWDVIDMEIAEAVLACDEGLLEPVHREDLKPGIDGTPAVDDFYPETLLECSVGTNYWSTVYAYDVRQFPGEKPTTIEDFFDLKKFPGRRGMRRLPQANLEFALMADAVPPAKVHDVLSTKKGLARAFRKLDSIKDHVVWWEAGAQPPQLLADGEVVMSTAYNGRIFNAQILEKQPFVIVWDAQVLSAGQLAIVAGTKKLASARKFIAHASAAASMAALTKYISYSPTRRSAESLISTHAATGISVHPHLPKAPANSQRVLPDNWRWWSDNGDEMNERFAAWLAR